MSKLYYCRQTTEKCKSIRYPSKSHPYKYGTSGCIYTSGCGVCASLMVLHNFGFTGLDTAAWTQKCLLMGARSADGTDMDKVAAFIEKHYSIVSKRAKTVADLKNHLKAGGKAIVCVSGGGKQLFSNGGHYIYIGGLAKSGNLIVLDPYWYEGKKGAFVVAEIEITEDMVRVLVNKGNISSGFNAANLMTGGTIWNASGITFNIFKDTEGHGAIKALSFPTNGKTKIGRAHV